MHFSMNPRYLHMYDEHKHTSMSITEDYKPFDAPYHMPTPTLYSTLNPLNEKKV